VTRAAVMYEGGKPLVVEELQLEEPRAGEVLVRVAAAGVCHSDLSIARGRLNTPVPAVLGHEGAGVVEAVGPGVTNVAVGDHVAFLYRAACGECAHCHRGTPALCAQGVRLRVEGTLVDGTTRFKTADGTPVHHFSGVSAFAEQTILPATAVARVSKDLSLETLAIVGCAVMTGAGAVLNAAKMPAGAQAVVFGCGGVGLSAIQGARIAGASRLIAVDIAADKLELAREMGATHTIDGSREEVVERVRELTGGQGADYGFETAGIVATLEQAIDSVRAGGMVVAVGIPSATASIEIPLAPFVGGEKTLRGSMYGTCNFAIDLPMLVDLYRGGSLMLDELVGRSMGLDEVNAALDGLEAGDVARTVLVP
jgi:S-(hydroxymethyl)glutathione dehydrogenase/alcohol dehydrogenase